MKYTAAIYLPSYNKRDAVVEAIQSAVNQTATFPYLIFVYENSTDGFTRELVLPLASEKVLVIEVDRVPDSNPLIEGFNAFVETIDADYYFYLEDDDMLEATFLEEMVAALRTGKDAVYCGTKHIRINGTVELSTFSTVFPNPDLPAEGALEPFVLGLSKRALERIGTPYWNDFPIFSTKDACEETRTYARRLAAANTIYPVTHGDDPMAAQLYIHRTLATSTWNRY